MTITVETKQLASSSGAETLHENLSLIHKHRTDRETEREEREHDIYL